MYWLVQMLVPISTVVVLPVLIVWIVFRSATNRDNKNAEVLIKAIENKSAIDADKLIEALVKPKKTAVQTLQRRLLRGCIFTFAGVAIAIWGCIMSHHNLAMMLAGISFAIGTAYLVVYFVTRKSVYSEKE